jgi:hypothetical protein
MRTLGSALTGFSSNERKELAVASSRVAGSLPPCTIAENSSDRDPTPPLKSKARCLPVGMGNRVGGHRRAAAHS